MTKLMLIWFPGRFSKIHQPALRPTICFDDYLRATVRPPSRQFNAQPLLRTYLKIFVVIPFLPFYFLKAPPIYFSNLERHRDFVKSLIFQGTNLMERKKATHKIYQRAIRFNFRIWNSKCRDVC